MCVNSPFLPPLQYLLFFFSLLKLHSMKRLKIIFFFFQDPGDAAQQEAKQRYEPELELSGRLSFLFSRCNWFDS